MSERDIVIVFGAGASYGAGHVQPEAPPLGASLYDALAMHYPADWGSTSYLGRMWAKQFREDFERTMSDEVLPGVPSLSLLESHRAVAKFFARYRLDRGGRDMYSVLLGELKRKDFLERLMLGSLNYDCLLEQALLELGLTVDYVLDDPHGRGSIPVAKIHGSCNFITEDLFSSRCQLTNANASSLECAFTALPVQNLEHSLRCRFSTPPRAIFPVLGLYSPHKPSVVAPGRLQALRNILAQRIVDARSLVLIGLRPTARDPHLWDPIAESCASKIGYVGGTGDYDALKKFQGKAVHVAETFDAAVTPILDTLLR